MEQNPIKQVAIRLPADVAEWLRVQAFVNRSSQNSEAIRAIRERMARVESEQARPGGGEAA